jgi:hypothetical protein
MSDVPDAVGERGHSARMEASPENARLAMGNWDQAIELLLQSQDKVGNQPSSVIQSTHVAMVIL